MKTDSIWKDNKTLPEILKDIAFYIDGDIHYGYFGQTAFWNNGNSGFFEPKDVEKWCYLDDLLEQSSKTERLIKALEIIKEFANRLRNLDDFIPIANARYCGDLIMDEILKIQKGE